MRLGDVLLAGKSYNGTVGERGSGSPKLSLVPGPKCPTFTDGTQFSGVTFLIFSNKIINSKIVARFLLNSLGSSSSVHRVAPVI